MIIPIGYPTSILFWLNANSKINLNQFTVSERQFIELPQRYDCSLNTKIAERIIDELNLPEPITVLVPEKSLKTKIKLLNTQQRPKILPPDSFIEIAEIDGAKIVVESPEFCFLQAARFLNIGQLLSVGIDLCGIYVRDKNAEYFQSSRNLVTDSEHIEKYLSKSSGCYGYRTAKQAVKYIIDHSNSVMETRLAILARVPAFLGGYGLGRPEMNVKSKLSEEGIRIMNGKNIFSDFVWEKEKVIVEYDSDLSHLTSQQHQLDKQRTNAILASGYTIIILTRSDVASVGALDEAFGRIRKALGIRNNETKLEKYSPVRHQLIHSLSTFDGHELSSYLTK